MQSIYFIILTILFLAFSKVENAGEILLTNLPNEKNQIQIPLAQKKNEGSGVGFHFKWTEGFCKPDGLLICYLSKLNVEGKMTKRFKIFQRKNGTKIREKCEEKMNLEGKNGEIWNGISLEGSSDLGRNIKMELSLTGEKYYFDRSEFTLELGTPTKLKMNDGNLGIDQINAGEMDLYSNFTGQINEGAYFDDFLGLWALGMDLLPSNGESLVIYVFRSCDCTMKAWFLPNSSPEKLPEWGQIDKRAECPEDKQKNYIELPNPLGKGKMLNISLKLAENTLTQVEIILYHRWTQETWSKYVGAIIDDQLEMYWAKAIDPVKNWQEYNYGDLLNITIKLGEESKIELENFDRRENYSFDGIGNGKDGRFTFQILQNEYNLSIGLNGEGWIVQDFWLKNWFHEIGVNIIKLEKLQFLLADPPVAQFDVKDLPKYEWVHVHKLAKELKGNELIILRAIMPKHIDEDGVNIKFLYNTNSEYVGNLHSSDHFYIVGESILAIKTNSHSIDKINVVPGMKPDKEGTKKDNPLEPGKLFELRISIPPRKFGENEAVEKYGISTYFNHTIIDEIEVDKTKFPLWKINRILIQGAQLIEEPRIIIPPEEKEKLTDYSINIKQLNYWDGKKGDLLVLGDQILIEGTVPNDAQEFIINLCFHEDNCMIHIPTPFPEDVHHPINKESKIGGIVLYIRVIFNSTKVNHVDYHRNQFVLNSWLRENEKGGFWQDEIKKKSHDLVPGKEFKMKIEVGELRPHTWHFLVMLNEQWAILDISEPCDESFGKCRMAPWSADHLQIFGDVKIPIGSITRKNIKQNDRALPYIKHFENGFQINENISYSIKGTHKVNNMSNENEKIAFTIGIYHDGIGNFDWQRKLYGVGESLIQLDFMMDGKIIVTTFAKYYALDGQMMLKPKTTIDGKWRNQKQIEVQIGLAVYNIGSIIEMFTIKVNQNDKIQTSALELDLPLWAGDYLYINTHTISGNFELTKEPDYVEN